MIKPVHGQGWRASPYTTCCLRSRSKLLLCSNTVSPSRPGPLCNSSLPLPGESLYIGTATGAVQVYTFTAGNDGKTLPKITWVKTHNLARRQIDQIGILPNAGYLLIVAGMCCSLP